MRVLHVYRTYFPDPPGGLQEAIRQTALATKVLGVDTRIFTLSPTPDPAVIERPEGRVIRSRSFGAPASCDIGGPEALCAFRREAAAADIVHLHFPWPFADLLLAALPRTTRCVMTYHSDIVRQKNLMRLYAPLMARTLCRMDRVVATSPDYAASSEVLKNLVAPEKLRVIPLGIVDEGLGTPQSDDAAQRATLGLDDTAPTILALGVLRYYKGLHTLVAAAPDINATIVIAGDGPEGPALRALAAERKASNVRFVGRVDGATKAALLRGCRALALPSHKRSEAFGMVLVEAAMCRKPQVCCAIGSGNTYVNVHNETGLVVPPEDPAALAEALNALIADPARAERLGHGARARYEALFSGPALGRAWRDLYQEVLNG